MSFRLPLGALTSMASLMVMLDTMVVGRGRPEAWAAARTSTR